MRDAEGAVVLEPVVAELEQPRLRRGARGEQPLDERLRRRRAERRRAELEPVAPAARGDDLLEALEPLLRRDEVEVVAPRLEEPGRERVERGGGIALRGGRARACLLYTSPSPRDS